MVLKGISARYNKNSDAALEALIVRDADPGND
jgi:hypothetical protein